MLIQISFFTGRDGGKSLGIHEARVKDSSIHPGSFHISGPWRYFWSGFITLTSRFRHQQAWIYVNPGLTIWSIWCFNMIKFRIFYFGHWDILPAAGNKIGPTTLRNVFDNLHGAVPKASVQVPRSERGGVIWLKGHWNGVGLRNSPYKIAIENGQQLICLLKMMLFHSYLSLPEGKL